jgi:hypothetical protein
MAIKKYQTAGLFPATKGPELQDVFRMYGKDFLQNKTISNEQGKVMRHIEDCRTATLGGHEEICHQCGFVRNAYNSCRDRHCPKCQTMVKEKWLNDRKAELLPCGYFHNVFTLPHELNPVILCNKKIAFSILFAAVNETLQAFSRDPQWRLVGQIGFIAVLHTWSQLLLDHFHLHCLIPAGVLSLDKRKWKPARKKKKYLFKITSLAKEFKKRYLVKLQKAYDKGELIFPGKTERFGTRQCFERLLKEAGKKRWVAYTKRPFVGPEQVLEYLGRYTHRVAITNNRIKTVDNGKVTFTYRDRRNNDEVKEMPLDAVEFIRRFLLHVLPNGFMKIRYFGFLSHTKKKECIPLLRKLIDPKATLPEKLKESIIEMMLRLTGIDITVCPECGQEKMHIGRELPRLSWDTS